MSGPAHGEVWLADLSPTVGRERAGLRPVLIVSPDAFNRGQLVLAVPLTRTDRRTPLHVRVNPPEGGLRSTSYVMCEQIRAVPRERLQQRWGAMSIEMMQAVVLRLRRLTPDP